MPRIFCCTSSNLFPLFQHFVTIMCAVATRFVFPQQPVRHTLCCCEPVPRSSLMCSTCASPTSLCCDRGPSMNFPCSHECQTQCSLTSITNPLVRREWTGPVCILLVLHCERGDIASSFEEVRDAHREACKAHATN